VHFFRRADFERPERAELKRENGSFSPSTTKMQDPVNCAGHHMRGLPGSD
jgi:hypothetical protein